MEEWYPTKLKVASDGTPETIRFMKRALAPDASIRYAEFGIYEAATAEAVAEAFPNAKIYLFDFESAVSKARVRLQRFGSRVRYFGNSQKYCDSYNWSLARLMEMENVAFDYCFLDGAHTFAVDALTYYLCDSILPVGGHLDFDDYDWRLKGSSLDPKRLPVIAEQYTDEQVQAFQVRMIVDGLVRKSGRYDEVMHNKVFRKARP